MRDKLADLRESPEYAEEKLVSSVQSLLEEILLEKGMSKSDLARKMGVSRSRVSQIFSDNQNFTFRLVAHAFHALGEELSLGRESKRVYYKSACGSSEGGLPFEQSTREISHGFEWLDGQMMLGRQAFGEAGLTRGVIADILKETLQATMEKAEHSRVGRHAGERERDSDRSATLDWSKDGSNVVPIVRRRVAHG